jgi:isoamylase
MRNMLATLLLSQGTPMLLAGDEFARTQRGNTNAYCQDNEISWVHWNFDEAARAQIAFVGRLTALRRDYPILRRSRFLTGEYNAELDVKDVTWIDASGIEMREETWKDSSTHCFGMMIDGRAQPTGIRQKGSDATVLIVFNAHYDVVEFTLPQCAGGSSWTLLIDTNHEHASPRATFETGDAYETSAHSLLLFVLQAAAT